MVKIAIAGAGSQLSREILDKLVATQKHEVIALVRKDPAQFPPLPGVEWVQTTYEDETELAQLLKGVHTVLCFFTVHLDPGSEAQKRLINAAVKAGVRRYAPSEWATGIETASIVDVVPWYDGKIGIRDYLEKLNQDKKVLEYSLFQVGQFLNYLGYPHKTTKHVVTAPLLINFDTGHFMALEGGENDQVTYTAVEDIANVVARAIDYEGEWPVVGGIRGSQVTIAELLRIGETIRGKPCTVDWLREEDLKAGVIKTDKYPRVEHPSIPEEARDEFTKMALSGFLIATGRGAWSVTDEWNQLLPDYEFVQVEDFLKKLWPVK
ncbi:hypothetical protein BJ170DRAFT_689956 [Xylariales sp. AK1849]|nr:hypothetical protein BJ170DRAFT_689956 [Xylariales sp. AK1849]